MVNQRPKIERKLARIKDWYEENFPLCLFCGHAVKEGTGDLSHIIRRSASLEMQTNKLNTGLAHRSCHSIFDNEPDQAVYLPRIIEILYIVYLLDENYFNIISSHYQQLAPVLQLFPTVPYQNIQHHGQLITLQYLIDQI